MRVLILGGDGYLGWPTAMHFADMGHEVYCIDNYLRRKIALDTSSEPLMPNPHLEQRAQIFQQLTGKTIRVNILDCTDYIALSEIFKEFCPDAVIHYAEQPSAPYSMKGFSEANLTFRNNLDSTFNVIWSVLEHAPNCHIVKLGTMGEYGTPDIDIEEGWLNIEHKGRTDKFLYPRQAGSLYHTTKVLDTDLLWFYVRMYGIRVSDLMQGPVYGLSTKQTEMDNKLLPNFHYDDIFGTVLNRFMVQAVAGVPLTVYGKGNQTRGYLNLKDTLQCVELAVNNPVPAGELRILNQFTELFSVNQLAERIERVGHKMGLKVTIQSIENPRKEKEEHYYHANHHGLDQMGLEPHYISDEIISEMIEKIMNYKNDIDTDKIMPRVRWN